MHVPESDLMVSISVLTYNHEDFIEKALDSILMQQRNFNIEIIVGDDFSTDSTLQILEKYQREHPELIHLIRHQKNYPNIPGRINNTTNLLNCRGKYIAMLDGDDYWTDPLKLQKQVDILEENPHISLTTHDMSLHFHGSHKQFLHSERHPELASSRSFSLASASKKNYFITSSVCYRNGDLKFLTEHWFQNIYAADYAIQLKLLEQGEAYYIAENMGVRRVHAQSFSSQAKEDPAFIKLRLREIDLFCKNIKDYAINHDCQAEKAGRKYALFRSLMNRKQYTKALSAYIAFKLNARN
jgi:glycosyltransferase involved in cell wall biosynthesis